MRRKVAEFSQLKPTTEVFPCVGLAWGRDIRRPPCGGRFASFQVRFGEGNDDPLQYSCLENPMGRGTWQAMVHRVAESRTRLKRLSTHSRGSDCQLRVSEPGVLKKKEPEASTEAGPRFEAAHLVKVTVAQSSQTLCDPVDSIVHGILQARILEWAAVPFSGGSSQPKDGTHVSYIAGRILYQLSHQAAYLGATQNRQRSRSPRLTGSAPSRCPMAAAATLWDSPQVNETFVLRAVTALATPDCPRVPAAQAVRYSSRRGNEERKTTSAETGYLIQARRGDCRSNDQAEHLRDQGGFVFKGSFCRSYTGRFIQVGVLGIL